jgi:hypothetical protein
MERIEDRNTKEYGRNDSSIVIMSTEIVEIVDS